MVTRAAANTRFSGMSYARWGAEQMKTSWLPELDDRADMVSLHSTGPRSSPRQRSGDDIVDMASERIVCGIPVMRASASCLLIPDRL